MGATLKINDIKAVASVINVLISDSPDPTFILCCDSRTVVATNQVQPEIKSVSRSYYYGKKIKDIVLFNSSDKNAPVYFNNNWFFTEEKSFELNNQDYVKITLKKVFNKPGDNALETTQKLIGMMLHRLRSPLTAVEGYSDLLTDTYDENRRKNHLEKINSGAQRISEVLDQFESLIVDSQKEQNERISFKSLQKDITTDIEFQAVHEYSRLVINSPKDIHFCGNRKLLKAVLTLLIENAFDHALDKESLVYISFESGHHIEIRSNGKQIPDGDADKIFKPFETTRADRTGVGLTLARILADKMGASIHLKSGEKGNVIFSVNLPPSELELLTS
ncbi:MAG: HAMP domain-containing histidine kinase [Balneolia bacterium]|nr:HAMP domain-containing histidine kinase [Balneolia bacterium]